MLKLQTRLSTIEMENDFIIKKTTNELFENETRVLLALVGIKGIPTIQLENNSIIMKKYQELDLKMGLYQIQQFMIQITTLLKEVHLRGWVHLDLSLHNILQDQGNVVLIDFALARKIEEEHPLGCGTIGYIAPEVFIDMITRTASDMYSLGIVFGQMLEPFLPGVSLHYLGSKLVRHPTTTFISNRLSQELIERTQGWKPILYHAADLLNRLLQYDHTCRITAEQVETHPFCIASENEFVGLDKKTMEKLLLTRPISSFKRPSRDPIVYYRG
jgi:serine/threonine protein kinase